MGGVALDGRTLPGCGWLVVGWRMDLSYGILIVKGEENFQVCKENHFIWILRLKDFFQVCFKKYVGHLASFMINKNQDPAISLKNPNVGSRI